MARAPPAPSRASRRAASRPAARGRSSRPRPRTRSRAGAEALVARVGQRRHQEPDELPPVAQRRPGQVLEPLGQLGRRLAALGVGDDRRRAEQLERRLPEVVGRVVPVERRLGVVGAAVELGQRQGQPPDQVVVRSQSAHHGFTIEGRGRWRRRSRCGTISRQCKGRSGTRPLASFSQSLCDRVPNVWFSHEFHGDQGRCCERGGNDVPRGGSRPCRRW